MSSFQLKVVSVLMEMLWWSGMLGLVVAAFEGSYAFDTFCCVAMIVALRWQIGLNTGSIKGLLKLVLKKLDKPRPARPL